MNIDGVSTGIVLDHIKAGKKHADLRAAETGKTE